MERTTANILVIEDHAVVQLGIRTLLSTCSMIGAIDIAYNGKEAIKKAEKNKFDIVLIDVELPDMTVICCYLPAFSAYKPLLFHKTVSYCF